MRIALGIIVILLTACSVKESDKSHQTVIDDLGREIKIPQRPTRILSLAPSITEIIYAIDAQELLQARTQVCDYPPEVLEKPVINTWPNLNYEKIIALQPDVVFALNSINSLQDANKLASNGIPTYFLKCESLDEIFRAIEKVGELTNHSNEAQELSDTLKSQYQKLCQENSQNRKRVVQLIALAPIYVQGPRSYNSDKLYCAGGINPVDIESTLINPQVSSEYILKLNPEIIFGNDSVTMQQQFFEKYPELKLTDAYKHWNVFDLSAPKHQRPSPRVIESLLEMRAAIQSCK